MEKNLKVEHKSAADEHVLSHTDIPSGPQTRKPGSAPAAELSSSDFAPIAGLARERSSEQIVEINLARAARLHIDTSFEQQAEHGSQAVVSENEESGLTVLDRIMNWLADLLKELDRRIFGRSRRQPSTQKKIQTKTAAEELQEMEKAKKKAAKDARLMSRQD